MKTSKTASVVSGLALAGCFFALSAGASSQMPKQCTPVPEANISFGKAHVQSAGGFEIVSVSRDSWTSISSVSASGSHCR